MMAGQFFFAYEKKKTVVAKVGNSNISLFSLLRCQMKQMRQML